MWERVLFLPASMWLPLPATSCTHLTGSVSRLLGFCDDLLLHVFANNQTYYWPAKTSGVKFLWLWTTAWAILQQKSVAANYSPGITMCISVRRTINSISCRLIPPHGNTRTETPPTFADARHRRWPLSGPERICCNFKNQGDHATRGKKIWNKGRIYSVIRSLLRLCICHRFAKRWKYQIYTCEYDKIYIYIGLNGPGAHPWSWLKLIGDVSIVVPRTQPPHYSLAHLVCRIPNAFDTSLAMMLVLLAFHHEWPSAFNVSCVESTASNWPWDWVTICSCIYRPFSIKLQIFLICWSIVADAFTLDATVWYLRPCCISPWQRIVSSTRHSSC